jgi:phosphatidylinositol dimannoside acyltransferase
MSGVRDEATYRLYATGWAVVKRLPERTANRLFDRIADRMWKKRGPSVQQLERNLARVLGPDAPPERLREVSRQALRNYLRYWCETFRLETWSQERIVSAFVADHEEYVRDLIASKRGLILALPHMGNWDAAGAWATTVVPQFTTVAERLKPEKLFARFIAFRESLGFEVLPLTGGSRTLLKLVQRLRAGGLVCLVADRDLTATGIPVDFFGETAKFPSGSASLALSTGAALVPVTLWFGQTGQRAIFHPEIPVPAEGTREQKIAVLTQAVADVFAAGIAEHPADWHMLQKFWLADLHQADQAHTDAHHVEASRLESAHTAPQHSEPAPRTPEPVRRRS